MFDPRSIANHILDECDLNGVSLTNITLQKLVYFCHSYYLLETGKPLVNGYFEAWKYGPVHPAVYKAFKGSGAQNIKSRARSYNPVTGEYSPLDEVDDQLAKRTIRFVLSRFGGMSAGQLVDLTHAPKGPWHFVVENAKRGANLGLRITDDVTLAHFKYLKLTVGIPKHGEPNEDAPFG